MWHTSKRGERREAGWCPGAFLSGLHPSRHGDGWRVQTQFNIQGHLVTSSNNLVPLCSFSILLIIISLYSLLLLSPLCSQCGTSTAPSAFIKKKENPLHTLCIFITVLRVLLNIRAPWFLFCCTANEMLCIVGNIHAWICFSSNPLSLFAHQPQMSLIIILSFIKNSSWKESKNSF